MVVSGRSRSEPLRLRLPRLQLPGCDAVTVCHCAVASTRWRLRGGVYLVGGLPGGVYLVVVRQA